jgi:hypothetical protein
VTRAHNFERISGKFNAGRIYITRNKVTKWIALSSFHMLVAALKKRNGIGSYSDFGRLSCDTMQVLKADTDVSEEHTSPRLEVCKAR